MTLSPGMGLTIVGASGMVGGYSRTATSKL